MKPVVKVLIVVAIVLVVIHIIKKSMAAEEAEETYIPFIQQEFETVPPQQQFTVTPSSLVINTDLTAVPVLTQVAGALPSASPTMVPTFVPTVLPTFIPTAGPGSNARATTVPVVTRAPGMSTTMAPVLTFMPTAAPSMITTYPA